VKPDAHPAGASGTVVAQPTRLEARVTAHSHANARTTRLTDAFRARPYRLIGSILLSVRARHMPEDVRPALENRTSGAGEAGRVTRL
jgi:hypothetical protein